mmetsp:Transcript_45552/g.110366  ORF Transcript_45552/g.110366 Transcript_45552/m.110366 type:complete len:296 (+) Transcript_45552:2137-3024(+)
MLLSSPLVAFGCRCRLLMLVLFSPPLVLLVLRRELMLMLLLSSPFKGIMLLVEAVFFRNRRRDCSRSRLLRSTASSSEELPSWSVIAKCFSGDLDRRRCPTLCLRRLPRVIELLSSLLASRSGPRLPLRSLLLSLSLASFKVSTDLDFRRRGPLLSSTLSTSFRRSLDLDLELLLLRCPCISSSLSFSCSMDLDCRWRDPRLLLPLLFPSMSIFLSLASCPITARRFSGDFDTRRWESFRDSTDLDFRRRGPILFLRLSAKATGLASSLLSSSRRRSPIELDLGSLRLPVLLFLT